MNYGVLLDIFEQKSDIGLSRRIPPLSTTSKRDYLSHLLSFLKTDYVMVFSSSPQHSLLSPYYALPRVTFSCRLQNVSRSF